MIVSAVIKVASGHLFPDRDLVTTQVTDDTIIDGVVIVFRIVEVIQDKLLSVACCNDGIDRWIINHSSIAYIKHIVIQNRHDAIDNPVLLAQVNNYRVVLLVDAVTSVLVHLLVGLIIDNRVSLEFKREIGFAYGIIIVIVY